MPDIFGNPTTVKKRYIPKHRKQEESIQMQACQYLRSQYPQVIFRSDYASGLKLTMHQAVKHKRMQSSRSWPDIFIYEPMQHENKYYCGLAIELKKDGTSVILKTGDRKGMLSTDKHIQEQAVMLKELNRKGYYANFAVGLNEFIKIVDWYMKRPASETASIF